MVLQNFILPCPKCDIYIYIVAVMCYSLKNFKRGDRIVDYKKETISKKECAEFLQVSTRTIERLIRLGIIQYANANDPHKHRIFNKEDIQNLRYRKDKKQRKTLEIVNDLFQKMDATYCDPNTTLSPLEALLNRKQNIGADIILEVQTFPVAGEPNRYIRSFPLRQYPSNPDAHAAAVLSLIRSIEEQGGTYHELNCSCSKAALPDLSPNVSIAENEYQIKDCILKYADGWFHDRKNFNKQCANHIIKFLRGEESCTRTGSYIILDKLCVLRRTGANDVNGTTIYIYLAVALPD